MLSDVAIEGYSEEKTGGEDAESHYYPFGPAGFLTVGLIWVGVWDVLFVAITVVIVKVASCNVALPVTDIIREKCGSAAYSAGAGPVLIGASRDVAGREAVGGLVVVRTAARTALCFQGSS